LKEAKKIETKVQYMQKFEAFLEKVKDQHPDEFQELNDILSRYQTLKHSNRRLQAQQDSLNKELEHYTTKI
jgi:hypothetical protein